MSLSTFIRAAQSENLHGSAAVSVVRTCRCGAQLAVNASGAGTAGASPSGLVMDAEDIRDAYAAAGRSAKRNASRNARWARCPKCGRRGRFAVVEAALTRITVAFPVALVAALFGCAIGIARETIDMNSLGSVCAIWGGGFGVVAMLIAGYRRLKISDRSVEIQAV